MFQQISKSLLLITIFSMITGCSTIFTAQEWSENYALLDGVQSTSPEMIDGNLETIGEAPLTSEDMLYSLNDNAEFVRNDSIVIVTLPEKKRIYRIILHSENLRHFVIYIDKGRVSSDEDWQRVTEMEDVRTSLIDLKLKTPYLTDKMKIRIIKTNPQVRKSKSFSLSTMSGSGRLDRSILTNRNLPSHAPGRIREIEIYGLITSEQK